MGFSRQEYWRGCHALLQGILPTQGLNPRLWHLLHWQVGSSPLVPPEKPSVSRGPASSHLWSWDQGPPGWKLPHRSRQGPASAAEGFCWPGAHAGGRLGRGPLNHGRGGSSWCWNSPGRWGGPTWRAERRWMDPAASKPSPGPPPFAAFLVEAASRLVLRFKHLERISLLLRAFKV